MGTRELDEDELAILESLLSTTDSKIDELYAVLDEETHVLKILDHRNAVYAHKIDKALRVMVLSLGDGIPGKCVKHHDYIVEYIRKTNYKQIDVEYWAQNIAPLGIPNF